MKIQDIVRLDDAMRGLIALDRSQGIRLSRVARVKLANNLRHVLDARRAHNEEHNAIVTEYGEAKKDHPDQIEVLPTSPKWAAFTEDMKELANVDHSIDIQQLTYEELFGKSPEEDKQNQIPIDVLGVFLDLGVLKEG